MPITLTTAFDVGDFDTNAISGEYTQVELTDINISLRSREITLKWAYGNTSGDFIYGVKEGSVRIRVDTWATVVGAITQTDEALGAAVKRVCYNYLINQGLVDGSIA